MKHFASYGTDHVYSAAMGATNFTVTARGKTASEAFDYATENARYENGHGGYTGTIAEKRSFVMVTPDKGESLVGCCAAPH